MSPDVCFDTLTPPDFESFQYHRSQTGNKSKDEQKYKHRIGALDDAHRAVAPFAPHLRILLYKTSDNDVLDSFVEMCKASDISESIIIRCDIPGMARVEASGCHFFSRNALFHLQREIRTFPWIVGFQLEALLHNGILHTEDIRTLFRPVQKLCVDRGHSYVDDFLRKYGEALQDRPPWESPIACFERIKVKYIQPKLTTSIFRCRHVTFTPTRMLFEGPYATQSNRIIRQFSGYEDYFLRVDFRDEDRLQYRWSREVDGASFVRERVGTTLKQGFEIAGKHFEFLAYSSSALREHAVWFMSPFQHPKYGFVNSAKIRDQIGDFRGKELIKQPSKYGARLAQAFTATEASVTIKRSEWEQVEDIKPASYKEGDTSPNLFTDGLGSISRALGDKIWTELCAGRQDHGLKSIKPSAVSLLTWFHIPSQNSQIPQYQIRFLGYKGVVAIDEQLDRTGNGIHMRLRNSMNKFSVSNEEEAPIEIARAFKEPNVCYLNRYGSQSSHYS